MVEYITIENANTNLVYNVKYLCMKNKMNLRDLEKHIGVTTGYFSRIKGGKKEIGAYKVYTVSKLFNVSIEDLLNKQMWKEIRKREIIDEIEQLKDEIEQLKKEYEDLRDI